MERGVFLEMRNYITSLFLNFKKIPQPVGETALQPTAFVAAKPWRTPRFGEVKRKKRKWKIKNGKMELRSPRGTEAGGAAAHVGESVVTVRRAAADGVVVPEAAAPHALRT